MTNIYLPDGTIPMPKSGGTFTNNISMGGYEVQFIGGTAVWYGGMYVYGTDFILNAGTGGKRIRLLSNLGIYCNNNIYFDDGEGIDFRNDGVHKIYFGGTTPNDLVYSTYNKHRFYTTVDASTQLEITDAQITAYEHLLPDTDNVYDLGNNTYRWGLIRGNVITSGDLGFEEKSCLKCGANFIEGDKLILVVKAIHDWGTLSVPIHLECADKPKVKRVIKIPKMSLAHEFVDGEIKTVKLPVKTTKTAQKKQIKKKQILTGTKRVQKMQVIQKFDEETGVIKSVEVPKMKKRLKTHYHMDKYGDITTHQDLIEVPDEDEISVYKEVPVAELDGKGNWKDEKGNILADQEALEDVEMEVSEIVYAEKEIEI